MSSSRKRPAGSADRSGLPDALTAPSASAEASARTRCADLAKPKTTPAPGAPRKIFGGIYLPEDGTRFVEAVNRQVDLVTVTELLMRSDDEKIKQRVLEQLLEMAYGKNVRPIEAPRLLSANVGVSDRD